MTFKLMIVPSNDQNNENKKFTIQYTKEELDKIQDDFMEHINKYIVLINNCIIKTIEKIEKEEEAAIVPPTPITIERD